MALKLIPSFLLLLHRFTDFQVNEIKPDGQVIHLRDVTYNEPRKDKDAQRAEGAEKPKDDETKPDQESQQQRQQEPQQEEEVEVMPQVADEDVAILTKLVSEEFAQDLVHLYQNANSKVPPKKKPSTGPMDDRSVRGQVHQEVRRIFDSRIETSTDDTGAIVASLVNRRGKKRGRGGNGGRGGARREEKPAGEYLYFTLYKDNRDTMDAVNQISRMLRVKPQVIGYAGTKDRRASTAQRCSLRYTRPRNLINLNGKLRGVVTGDYEWADEPLRLGQLLGNEFVITIKNCQPAGRDQRSKPVAEKLEALRAGVQASLGHMARHGWINYFGNQRFGTHSIGTHEIGKLLLGERYEDAVNALLHYDPDMAAKAEAGEMPQEMHKREEYSRHYACMLHRTGKDSDLANQVVPRRFSAEVCVLRHLNRQGAQSRRDFVGAVIHITRGLRTMYLHAYQSHVWNHAASRRWELHGAKVVKGDLVIVDSTDPAPQTAGGEPAPKDEDDDEPDDVINPAQEDNDDESPLKARPLTEEEAASGKYTIKDVVLPLPGYDVTYPDNDIGAFYADFMGREENGSLDPHRMRRMKREFSLPGRYRKLMNYFLSEPSVDFRPYRDDTEQMHPTDLDLVTAARGEPESKKSRTDGARGDVEMGGEAGSQAADKIAAVVKFQLGSSAYATVTLRELMGEPSDDPGAAGESN